MANGPCTRMSTSSKAFFRAKWIFLLTAVIQSNYCTKIKLWVLVYASGCSEQETALDIALCLEIGSQLPLGYCFSAFVPVKDHSLEPQAVSTRCYRDDSVLLSLLLSAAVRHQYHVQSNTDHRSAISISSQKSVMLLIMIFDPRSEGLPTAWYRT